MAKKKEKFNEEENKEYTDKLDNYIKAQHEYLLAKKELEEFASK